MRTERELGVARDRLIDEPKRFRTVASRVATGPAKEFAGPQEQFVSDDIFGRMGAETDFLTRGKIRPQRDGDSFR